MAKSKSFFGLRKGSTKSHTFSVLDGQQVTKDRVYDVKNPRTEGQMRQRMLMTTVGAAYKYLKSIADHSFEGKSSGMQCMREFNSRNLNRFKNAASAKGSVAFNEYKDGDINPLPFILSAGSLPGFVYGLNASSQLEVSASKEDADLTTAEGIYAALGISRNDLITFCTVIGDGAVVSGVFDYVPARFDVVRLVADKTGAVSSPIDAFTVSTNNLDASINVSVVGNTLTITSGDADFGAVIQSRKTDSAWLRSTAVMVVSADLIAGVKTANQLATYPIGTELILNNGPMANQSEDASSSLPTPSLSFAAAQISANGTATVNAPALSGTPSGATVTYISLNPSIATVDATSGVITPISNGTATIVAKTSKTDEYAAGQASFKIVVSGIEEKTLTLDPAKITFTTNGQSNRVSLTSDVEGTPTVDMGSVSGVTYTLASDNKSITFTCANVDNGVGGEVTVSIANAKATLTVVIDSGDDGGLE